MADPRLVHKKMMMPTGWCTMRYVLCTQTNNCPHFLCFPIFPTFFIFSLGVISGAMLPLRRAFDLTATQQEVVVSSTVFAALLSSLGGGTLNHKVVDAKVYW